MSRHVGAVARHVGNLFVDDGGMAGAVLAWLGLVGLLAPLVAIAPVVRGPVLLAGLVVLLCRACLRAARRRH